MSAAALVPIKSLRANVNRDAEDMPRIMLQFEPSDIGISLQRGSPTDRRPPETTAELFVAGALPERVRSLENS
jgi:hypothetical protein